MCVCVCVLSTMYQTQWVVEGQLLCMRFVSVIIFKYSENIWRLCNFYCSFHSPLCEQFLKTTLLLKAYYRDMTDKLSLKYT